MSLFKEKSNNTANSTGMDKASGVTSGADSGPVVKCLERIVDQVAVIQSQINDAEKYSKENGQGTSMFKGNQEDHMDELKKGLESVGMGAEELYNSINDAQAKIKENPTQS